MHPKKDFFCNVGFMEQYITQVIEALHPFGDVLEVGFGPSSKVIQKYLPRTHTIITLDPAVDGWGEKHPSVKVIHDEWEGALPSLGVFDAIFFGIDPHENPLFQKLPKFRYTDSELESFCESAKSADPIQLSRFLAELEQNGQITEEQFRKMVHKYGLKKGGLPPAIRSDQLAQFCKRCISFHTRKGSRISCFLKDFISPSLNREFFVEIVTNPALDYKEDGRVIVIERLV